jgi:DNA topoisomerase VI subunit A
LMDHPKRYLHRLYAMEWRLPRHHFPHHDPKAIYIYSCLSLVAHETHKMQTETHQRTQCTARY